MMRNNICPCGIAVAPTSAASLAVATAPTVATPEALAPSVDEARLSTIEQKLKSKEVVIYFDFGQSATNLTEEQRQVLADVTYYLSQKKDANITVTGHTDSRGKSSYNQSLSEQRASFIAKFLTENGSNNNQITSFGHGESQPITSNKTASGRAQNRRVIISIT
jgi:outer membrane protein OmpA-like peptidoglycan-associated protein